ncbi:hypothetical protein [Bacillus seohaeanensis]|jgi:hypothetical protein|uniref:Carboxypeptidase regulatory-like domain-containing protein n=1 Tax=Bacillus seohaeanensis TaxID=284580 RepID=A0ABW5RSA1_9BACI
MKKDDLKKLFDYVDENEKASVEFQTVWRKAHRKNWKKRLFQSAGHNLAILITILILTPIVGHYVINQNPISNSAQYMSDHSSQSDYSISGKVYNFPNQIVIKGESNLPEGTIINIEHLEKSGETLLFQGKVATDSDGSFQFTTDRLEKNKEYVIDVTVYSHIQNQNVKNMLGDRGENLMNRKNKNSVFQYHQDGENYSGLRKLGFVNKIDDTSQYVIAEFLMAPQEFEAIN